MVNMKAAIFDLDGTLIDSMWIWENLLIDFLSARGICPPEHLLNEVTHMSIIQSSAYVQQFFNLSMSADEVLAEWRQMAYSAYEKKISLKPGAKKYLLHLKEQGTLLAIATSCDQVLCEACLKNNGIFDLFSTITYADEVGKGKNFPDIYLECLRRLQCSPKEVFLFEDILVALRTGKKIGMNVIAVEDKSSAPDHDAMKREANQWIRDFNDLL